MGTVRSLLALTVVLAHCYGYFFVGGRNAVQLFYIITGFLISYLIVETKLYSSKWTFYLNRFLRIYPVYFVVAVMTLLLHVCVAEDSSQAKAFFHVYEVAPIEILALLLVSNITLLFIDWTAFVGVTSGTAVFTANFQASELAVGAGLLVPQAWTLGVELLFYLIAPFVLKYRVRIIFLLLLSVLVRLTLLNIDLARQDPWSYRFFPAELIFFLVGSLSHQLILPVYLKKIPDTTIKSLGKYVFFVSIALIISFKYIPLPGPLKSVFLFTFFIAALPLIFLFSLNHRWDTALGRISYPIYISHMFLIYISENILIRVGVEVSPAYFATFVVGLTIISSFLLYILVDLPVERLRREIRK